MTTYYEENNCKYMKCFGNIGKNKEQETEKLASRQTVKHMVGGVVGGVASGAAFANR